MATARKPVHPLDLVATSDDRIFILGRHRDVYDKRLLLELVKNKPVLVETYDDVEGLVAKGNELFATGETVHRFDGTRWTKHAAKIDIHSPVVIDDALVGVGRDGATAIWDKTSWKKLAAGVRDLHLTGIAKAGGEWFVCGSNKAKGVLFRIAKSKLVPIKLPATNELLAIATLPGGRLLVTGRRATALIGEPDALAQLAVGRASGDFGGAVVWNDRVLVAGRASGVLELVDDKLVAFSKDPTQGLTVAAGRLWRRDLSGLSWWQKSAWKTVDLAV